jgi:hypothetical protein
MVVNYYASDNRYTDPVRYFKANDPYYYEVDNIPIKQLEENSKFLKDQVDGLLKQQGGSSETGLSRNFFNELKPIAAGADNIVKVLPGRYTARINDAYSIDPLQFIEQIFDPAVDSRAANSSVYKYGVASRSDILEILNKWYLKTESNATLMNGLFERVFIHSVSSLNEASDQLNTNNPENVREPSQYFANQAFWPGYIGKNYIWLSNSVGEALDARMAQPPAITNDEAFRTLGRLENEFIRRWRGVTRTSVVDVAETLEIEIPNFNSQDFFYWNNVNQKEYLDSSQRIDLVFIYSKAIDQDKTTVPSYNQGVARTLTKPALGIVKGAGIGIRRSALNQDGSKQSRENLQSLDGVTLMMPNPSDELAENTGFQVSGGVVRGSFPSPDDLMNLAPVLAENLSNDSIALVGQSILPIAYVVVKNNSSLTEEGLHIVNQEDIIDIRPFFRTTELTYNERSGLAAATPQVSLGNPVVTEGHLDFVKKELNDTIFNLATALGVEQQTNVTQQQTITGNQQLIQTAQSSIATLTTKVNNIRMQQRKTFLNHKVLEDTKRVYDLGFTDEGKKGHAGNFMRPYNSQGNQVQVYSYLQTNYNKHLNYIPAADRPNVKALHFKVGFETQYGTTAAAVMRLLTRWYQSTGLSSDWLIQSSNLFSRGGAKNDSKGPSDLSEITVIPHQSGSHKGKFHARIEAHYNQAGSWPTGSQAPANTAEVFNNVWFSLVFIGYTIETDLNTALGDSIVV